MSVSSKLANKPTQKRQDNTKSTKQANFDRFFLCVCPLLGDVKNIKEGESGGVCGVTLRGKQYNTEGQSRDKIKQTDPPEFVNL